MPIWAQILIGLVAGASGIAAIINALQSRRTVRSSARKTDVEALTATIEALQGEIERLYARQSELETEQIADRATIRKLQKNNSCLQARVEELERENCELRGARAVVSVEQQQPPYIQGGGEG